MRKQWADNNSYKKHSGWALKRENRMWTGEVILISLYYHKIFTLTKKKKKIKKKYNVILC